MTFKIYILNSFQEYNTVLLTRVTMLLVRAPKHVHHRTWSLYLFTTISPFLLPLHPWQSQVCSLLLWVLLFHIIRLSEIIQHLSFSVWLISLSKRPSSFIHVLQIAEFSSFYGWIIFHCVSILYIIDILYIIYIYIYHIFFIYSSVKGHLHCFHGLAIMSNAVTNVKVQIPI